MVNQPGLCTVSVVNQPGLRTVSVVNQPGLRTVSVVNQPGQRTVSVVNQPGLRTVSVVTQLGTTPGICGDPTGDYTQCFTQGDSENVLFTDDNNIRHIFYWSQ